MWKLHCSLVFMDSYGIDSVVLQVVILMNLRSFIHSFIHFILFQHGETLTSAVAVFQ